MPPSWLRLPTLALGGLLGLGGAVQIAWQTVGVPAVEAGRQDFVVRDSVLAKLSAGRESTVRARAHGTPPTVVAWLGDSTLLAVDAGYAYPDLIERAGVGVRSWTVAESGLDGFAQYFMAARAVESRPDALVLVTNMRLFAPAEARPSAALAQLVPPSEWGRAMNLPLSARGITVPRLMLTRALESSWVEERFLFLSGLRVLFQQAAAWGPLGDPGPTPKALALPAFFRAQGAQSRAYDVPIGASTPGLRMVAAAVRLAVRHDIPVLVVLTAIPWEVLVQTGTYDEGRVAARIAIVRATLEASGARFLDAHRAIPRAEFRDQIGGHFNAAGFRHMQELVQPALLDLLEKRPSADQRGS